MKALDLLRQRASEYELLAEWHAERAAGELAAKLRIEERELEAGGLN